MSRRNEHREFIAGLIFILLINGLVALIEYYFGVQPTLTTYWTNSASAPFYVPIFFFGFIFIGISQFLYVIPIISISRQKQKFEFQKGVLTGALVTLFLNCACFALPFLSSIF